MSDLPPIRNGEQKPVTKYDRDPESHYQRAMRKNTIDLTDHICKQVTFAERGIIFLLFFDVFANSFKVFHFS